LKKLGTYIMKYWYAYFIGIVCMITAIVLDMLYPLITQSIIDDVILKGKMELLAGLLLGIFIIGLGRGLGGYVKEYTFDSTSVKIGAALRKDLFSYIQGLSMDYFDDTNTGELMARIKDDVDYIWNAVGYVGMLAIEVVIHVIIVLFCMFRLNWKLAFIPALVMAVIGSIAVFMEKKLNSIYEEISEENARLTTIAEENLAGVRTVKAFAREDFEIKKFLSHNKRYYDLNMKQSKVLVRYYPVFQFMGRLLPVAMVLLGGGMVIRGEMTLGAMVAFAEYCRNIVWPMEMLGWLTNDMSTAVASYKKIKKIYRETAAIQEPEHPVALEKVTGALSFEHVDFQRGDKSILKDITFELKPGQTLGIMGATGSGKTSIVNLLLRFFDVDGGAVKVDGQDVRKLSLKQLRSSISMVMQDVFLFSDTIEENIKMGRRRTLDRETMEQAARLSMAEDFIEEMNEKYDTVIGERGVGLSGGQKQRISIARAIAKHNPILVLDDSTSALDMETESQIQESLEALKGTTKIIIAHRISAVRSADEILFLEHGRIKERGTHETLMKQKGLYYDTYQAQYAAADSVTFPEKKELNGADLETSKEKEVIAWQ
jgi:ATP-binding cassette subfamily B multidrug efflux pump